MKAFVALFAVTALQPACDLREGSSLSELSTAGVAITVSPSAQSTETQAVLVNIIGPGDGEQACVKIADEVHATLDGAAMKLASHGEWHEATVDLGSGGSWCSSAGFVLESLPLTTSGRTSTIVIADDATTWTIEIHDLLANVIDVGPVVRRDQGYELDVDWPSAAGSIHWLSGTAPHDPYDPDPMYWAWWDEPNNGPSNVTVSGNRISLQAPTQIPELSLEAERLGRADTCNGPAGCGLDINASVDRVFGP
jgi:hypothetical protein